MFRCPENTDKPLSVKYSSLNRPEMMKSLIEDLSWKTIKFKQQTQYQSFNIMQEFKKVHIRRFLFWLVYGTEHCTIYGLHWLCNLLLLHSSFISVMKVHPHGDWSHYELELVPHSFYRDVVCLYCSQIEQLLGSVKINENSRCSFSFIIICKW